jgi:GDP-L-fucose synthase
MHFIFDLIRKIIRGKEFGEKVSLWGDGNQKREIIHVNDFVNILCELTEKYDNQIFNIGAGQEYSIKFFAKSICEIVDYPFENIDFDTTKYVGALSKCLNIEKIKTSMPDLQLKSMNEGLKETIQWFYDKKAYELIE